MGIMNACRKCGEPVCACGFAATLAVSVLEGGNPPPRVVGPILAQLTGTVGTMLPSVPFVEVSDQITGKLYSAPWLHKQKQRVTEYSARPLPPTNFSIPAYLTGTYSTASIAGPLGVGVTRGGLRGNDAGRLAPN
jgi:hypothetical protein